MSVEQKITEERKKEPIVAFCCNHSGFEAYERACRELAFEDSALRVVRMPCSGKVDIPHILYAFENGAYGVLVFACYKDNCKYIHGNVRAEKRIADVKGILQEIGIQPERVEFKEVASNTPYRIKNAVEQMRERLSQLGSLNLERNNNRL
ncbi:MAG: hydrogenase iron-sulfur subunit [Candidatus Schekmanbacteria bacterium]|nr:MAG: hydrogenase iron-sulfur subunit [Candidatus Schekmanbacteria bacterium]